MMKWVVVSSKDWEGRSITVVLAVFKSLVDALEYAAFVTVFDEERFPNWLTYVVEGTFDYV